MADQGRPAAGGSGSAVSMGGSRTIFGGDGMFRALDIQFAPGLRLPRHHHNEPNFVVTRSGAFERRSAGGDVRCAPGTIFTEPAGEPHGNVFGGAGATVLIVQPLKPAGDFSSIERSAFETQSTFASYDAARVAVEIAEEVRLADAFSSLAIDGLALQMLTVALRAGQRNRTHGRPRWLRRVVEAIHDDPTRRLSLARLAEITGVHPSHLARTFRSAYGVSLGRFARNARLDSAAMALSTTRLPISQIALDAGFADQSHFTRAFKHLRGMTPAEFRTQRGTLHAVRRAADVE